MQKKNTDKVKKIVKREKGWNDPLMKLPEVTIFSTNPITNKPYMTLEYAENLAFNHIYKTAKNLLEKHEAEDLKQELMLKMCMSKFDPALSNAQTFAITCMTSQCARIWERTFKVRDKHRETSDFELYTEEDGTTRMATEVIGVDYVTPEEFYSAKETVAQFVKEQETLSVWNQTNQPDGWKGIRPGRWEQIKSSNKRKKSRV